MPEQKKYNKMSDLSPLNPNNFSMSVISNLHPNIIFIGKQLKDNNPEKEENMVFLSNIIGHEELHHEVNKIDPTATKKLDTITIPAKIKFIDISKVDYINPTQAGKIK
jgi:hypothetical protein